MLICWAGGVASRRYLGLMRHLLEPLTRPLTPANSARIEVALERESCGSRATRQGPRTGGLVRQSSSSLGRDARKGGSPPRRSAAGSCRKTAHSSGARCLDCTCRQPCALRRCRARRALEGQIRHTRCADELSQGCAPRCRPTAPLGGRAREACHGALQLEAPDATGTKVLRGHREGRVAIGCPERRSGGAPSEDECKAAEPAVPLEGADESLSLASVGRCRAGART